MFEAHNVTLDGKGCLMVEEHGEGAAMTSEASDVAAVVARLGKVERELRWWRLAALGDGVLLIGLGASPQGTTLEAERLVIRDAKGIVRAALGTETEKEGASPDADFGLWVYTKDGARVAYLTTTPLGGAQIALSDREGKASAMIWTDPGMPQVLLSVREADAGGDISLIGGAHGPMIAAKGNLSQLSIDQGGLRVTSLGGKVLWKAP